MKQIVQDRNLASYGSNPNQATPAAYHFTAFIIFLIMVVSCETTQQVQPGIKASLAYHDSIIKDKDGNRYPVNLFADHRLWMTVNLKLNLPGSWCYGEMENNCKHYGRLYTWEAAQKGCSLLGPGWRLPTNEEWQQLAKPYGGVRDDSDDKGNAAYKTLLSEGAASFNAILGGGRDMEGNYARIEAHGFYWTATETDTGKAWFYNFGKGAQMLNRHKDGEKSRAFSVRCVKSFNTSK